MSLALSAGVLLFLFFHRSLLSCPDLAHSIKDSEAGGVREGALAHNQCIAVLSDVMLDDPRVMARMDALLQILNADEHVPSHIVLCGPFAAARQSVVATLHAIQGFWDPTLLAQ